jgi:hypothetical protein
MILLHMWTQHLLSKSRGKMTIEDVILVESVGL